MVQNELKVVIDCDDAAIDMKQILVGHLRQRGVAVTDLDYQAQKAGAMYPEIAYNLAEQIQQRRFDRGILICGTGLGMAMVANKVEGVFAGTCHDVFSAERLKKSNDANVLTLGARVIGSELAKMIVDAWLRSEFQGGGSLPKVQQMRMLEKQSFEKERTAANAENLQ